MNEGRDGPARLGQETVGRMSRAEPNHIPATLV
jgi:hypothetical protein